jgi:hypothetical protein
MYYIVTIIIIGHHGTEEYATFVLLNVADGEPWTDGGWTKVAPKKQVTRPNNVATIKRSDRNNGHDVVVDRKRGGDMYAMKTNLCNCNSEGEHGYMCDRECQKDQQLEWKIEHID